MALFRVEILPDHRTGLYFVEVYYPDDAAAPFVITEPQWTTMEEAQEEAVNAFKRALPKKIVTADMGDPE